MDYGVSVSIDFPRQDPMSPPLPSGYVPDRVGNQFIDQKSRGNGVVGREQHWISVAIQRVPIGVAVQLLAELGHEVRQFDLADMRTAPNVTLIQVSTSCDTGREDAAFNDQPP